MTVGSARGLSDWCLSGGGEMGARMRGFDWSTTVLGPVENWPQSLKTAIGICLNSQFSVALCWGPELTFLCNDTFVPLLGSQAVCQALGRPAREGCVEVWTVVGPLFDRVMMTGEAETAENVLLITNGNGYPEGKYFRFWCSPVRAESGGVGGVFTAATETTGEDSICVLNRNGELLSFNCRAAAAAQSDGSLSGARWPEVFSATNPDAAARAIEQAVGGETSRLEVSVTAGAETKWWNTVFSPIRHGAGLPERILAVSRESTEQKRTEQQLMLLVRASATLLSASPATVVESIIQLAKDFVAADAYAVWRRDSPEEWRIVSSSGLSDAYRGAHFSGGSAPGETMVVQDVLAEELVRRRFEHYRKEGVRSFVMVPLRSAAEVNGTLVFYYRTPHVFSASEVSLCTAVGNLAAAAMEAARLYRQEQTLREEAEEARSRAMFLAHAGAILASSLDIEWTLQAIGELAVPRIADWCAIDLVQAEGPPRRVTVRHVNPELLEKAAWLRAKYPPREGDGFFTALRTGKTVFVAEVTDEMLQLGARSEEHLQALRELGIRSCVLAPLMVHGERLGVLTLVRSQRLFSEEDVAFIEEIAQRAAFAVRGAGLHHAVSESAERLAVATGAAGLGIFEWNTETGGVRWENQRIFDIFQRTREQGPISYEEFFAKACHPEDREKMLNEIAASQAARRPMVVQIRMRREDGEWIWVEFNGQFDFDPLGRPRRLVGVVSDVTERRKMDERLRERAKLESVGLLAGGVAHDFNNLLTGILGNATLALDVLSAADGARPMIEGVVAASERAAALTQQMLAYSGRGRFVIAPVDISKLVRDMSGLLRTSIDRSIELRLDLDAALPSVEADCVQMQQLVMNLIINAAESMQDQPGAVTVRTFLCDLDESAVARLNPAFEVVPGHYVCLEVTDEGCGMDEATMARIFDPFFTTKFTGRGLGLSAVLGIVRGHKGSLEVASEVRKGTTFRIHLPAIVPLEQLTSLWRGTVLVVDDEEIVRKTASNIIEAAGFRVIIAENGAEALRRFHAHKGRIDLTILDLSMPVMGGEAALERIRQQWPEARVVISTGFAAEDTVRCFSTKGVAGFLQKPYTMGRVTELLRALGLTQPN